MFLKNGTVVFDGRKEELMASPVPEIQVYLSELAAPSSNF